MAHTRRGFLARIGAAAIGLTLASKLPGIASAPPRLAEPQTGQLRTDGWSSSAMPLRAGDVFTISGCYVAGTGRLQQFVVQADDTPPLVLTGARDVHWLSEANHA